MRLELLLRVVEVDGVAPVVVALRPAGQVTRPRPWRRSMRRAGTAQNAAYPHAAPDHRVIVGVALAGDDGRAHGEGFVGHAPCNSKSPVARPACGPLLSF